MNVSKIMIGSMIPLMILTGCVGIDNQMRNEEKPVQTVSSKLDYNNKDNWAVFENTDKKVDVFFVAPTATHSDTKLMNMDEESKAAFLNATLMEKGIYDDNANFYAPYYTQMSLEAYDLSEKDRQPYLDQAMADVENAFEYYMKNINNGKPIILAGFSQGGEIIKKLLEKHPEIQDKLVAAYVIGWNVTQDDLDSFPSIKMAQNDIDTGVVVSFCSEDAQTSESIIVPTKTIGINPLNWKTDSTVATKEENKGSCFLGKNGNIDKEQHQLCGAYLDKDRGTLKVTDISREQYPARLSFLKDGNYHIYDYQFFYRNLEQNVQDRIQSYFDTHK